MSLVGYSGSFRRLKLSMRRPGGGWGEREQVWSNECTVKTIRCLFVNVLVNYNCYKPELVCVCVCVCVHAVSCKTEPQLNRLEGYTSPLT